MLSFAIACKDKYFCGLNEQKGVLFCFPLAFFFFSRFTL
jgi:hypothetical protein